MDKKLLSHGGCSSPSQISPMAHIDFVALLTATLVFAPRTETAPFFGAAKTETQDELLSERRPVNITGHQTQFIRSLSRNPANYPNYDKPCRPCSPKVCRLPNCRCAGPDIPGSLPVAETPQMIMLTFDDAVTNENYRLYSAIYNRDNRHNPNGCPIRGAFYVSHEWTEYDLVQTLYADGHEIASHTISHPWPTGFTKQNWEDEFVGQRSILKRMGNVEEEDVTGARAPFLQTGGTGNEQFEMLWENGFLYDSSLIVPNDRTPTWPYTLEYSNDLFCVIPPCPTHSYPGLWEVPLIDWTDQNGSPCSMADSCGGPTNAEEVYEMIMANFKRHYESSRAPFPMFYHASWFVYGYRIEGLKKFIDAVLALPDVWFVTPTQAIQWMKQPTPLSAINQFDPWSCHNRNRPGQCTAPNTCDLYFGDGMRYIKTCTSCPESYPWLRNTEGSARMRILLPPVHRV